MSNWDTFVGLNGYKFLLCHIIDNMSWVMIRNLWSSFIGSDL